MPKKKPLPNRPKRIIFSEQQLELAQRLLDRKAKATDIAAALCCSVSTYKRVVRPQLSKDRLNADKSIFNRETAKEIISFWAAIGIKPKAIARLCRCSKEELVERFAHELDTAESHLVSQMASVVINAALNNDTIAARWVLDRRGGPAWRRKAAQIELSTPTRPPGADIPSEPTVEDSEAARREAVRLAVGVLSEDARDKLQDVVDEMRLGNAKLLN